MTKRRLPLLLAASLFAAGAQAEELIVSAAASLTNAFKEIGQGFERKHAGDRITFNFAASGALLAQIEKGAPVDVFASADQETMDKAEAGRHLEPGSRRDFAGNSLVVVVPRDSTLKLDGLAALADPEVERVAIGNPATTPNGRYARAALAAAGQWGAVEPKLVLAENVRQSLNYVGRGEVEAGFVFATDAAQDKDKVRIALEVPTEQAIVYPIAVVAGSRKPLARAFVDYVRSAEGQAVLKRYGFKSPN